VRRCLNEIAPPRQLRRPVLSYYSNMNLATFRTYSLWLSQASAATSIILVVFIRSKNAVFDCDGYIIANANLRSRRTSALARLYRSGNSRHRSVLRLIWTALWCGVNKITKYFFHVISHRTIRWTRAEPAGLLSTTCP
jgi:hypothetical protein